MLVSLDGSTDPSRNLVLAALPGEEREALLSRATMVELPARKLIAQRYQPLEHVYFPLSGMVSLVNRMQDDPPSRWRPSEGRASWACP
jgi:hypothetical protein